MYKLKVLLSDIPDKKINEIKNFTVDVVDEKEIEKLKNILKPFQIGQKLSIPVSIQPDRITLRLSTQKLEKYIDTELSNLPPIKWNGFMVNINFNIKKYSFKNQNPSIGQVGHEIQGLSFICKKLYL